MLGECNFLGSISSQQKFETMDIKALGASQLLDSPCYSSQTDQFYLDNKGEYIPKVWGQKEWREERESERDREHMHVGGGGGGRERERDPWPFGSSF